MLIRNSGLFWHRDQVNWGRPIRGSLDGYLAGAKRSGFVDFREQRGVYVLYDDTFRIVYVGTSGKGRQCLFARLKQHKTNHLAQRWSRFSWFGTRSVNFSYTLAVDQSFRPTLSDVLNHIEGILLAAAEPPLNLQRGRFGEDVEQYLQADLARIKELALKKRAGRKKQK